MAKPSQKHIRAIVIFTETEVYARLMQEIKKNGSLPTDKRSIFKLLKEARNLAIKGLIDAVKSSKNK